MTATSREPAKPSSNGRLLQQWRRLGGWQIVLAVAAAWFVLEHLHPELLVRDTTPTGGDTGAHVWAPDALRRDLFGDGKLSGWSPDWFAGFPAFRFYMVVPAAAIALLGTVIPPNIAFKLVVAAGPVSLPVAAYAAGRLARLPAPTPGLFAVATVPFLFDRYHTIWGGNIAASLAGEFGYSLSLSLSLLALGLVAAGVRDGRGQARAAAVLALAVLCHPIPALFAAFGSVAIVALTGDPRRWLWLARVGAAALTITAFWTVPFLWDRALVVDLGWEPIGDEIDALFRLDAGRDHLRWVVAAAGVGTVTAWTGGRLFERALPVTAAGLAVTIVSLPAGQLWNARLLPLWYLCLHLLAASGVGAILRAVVTGRHQLLARRWTPTTQIAVIVSVGLGAASAAVVAGSVGVVIGIAAALLIGSEAAILGGPRQGSQLAMIGASGLIVAAVLISVAMPLRSLPFGSLDD
ncbi:MAG: 6-pyruvoyl-tetrahydropterin synthase-related protein, partial [Acidimicrobiia bacterium]|nr:6-pyruvoyl-tetrahydropterin synthase-related protein [Acidimicrobiia bacterium]